MVDMIVNENGIELIQTLPDAFSIGFFDVELLIDGNQFEIYDIIESHLELIKFALLKCYKNLHNLILRHFILI